MSYGPLYVSIAIMGLFIGSSAVSLFLIQYWLMKITLALEEHNRRERTRLEAIETLTTTLSR